MYRLLSMLVLFCCLAAPAGADGETGKGTLHLHPAVMQGYAKFLATYNPSYFAVSTNGLAYGYVYCPDQACFTSDRRGAAIRSCSQDQAALEKKFAEYGIKQLKGECLIFANASRILWQGEVIQMDEDAYYDWLKTSGFLVVE